MQNEKTAYLKAETGIGICGVETKSEPKTYYRRIGI